jgi:ABC-2 type transport system permease protein
MRNVWLIARREYLERVRTRGFVITTVLIPAIMCGFLFGSSILGGAAGVERHIAVVSADTQLALDLKDDLERQPTSAGGQAGGRIETDVMEAGPDTRTIVEQELDAGDLDGYLWITPGPTRDAPPVAAFTPRAEAQQSLRTTVAAAMNRVLMRERLANDGVARAEADAMTQPVQVTTVRAPRREDHDAAEISVTVLFFLMYVVIMLYGMNVARSIIEEKTSRVFEVLLATIRPQEMMAGKILGVGSVGLTQVSIWLAAGLALAGSVVMPHLDGQPLHIVLSASQVIYFFVYFLLGYLLYSSIAAALGAMTNSEQELQQLNLFLVLPLAFCFVALKALLTNPDSGVSRALALVPPFTPLLMYVRVTLGHPAAWEVALSLALTSASIWGTIWVTSRIYRVGVLMYGKRPNLGEIFRWLRYS